MRMKLIGLSGISEGTYVDENDNNTVKPYKNIFGHFLGKSRVVQGDAVEKVKISLIKFPDLLEELAVGKLYDVDLKDSGGLRDLLPAT